MNINDEPPTHEKLKDLYNFEIQNSRKLTHKFVKITRVTDFLKFAHLTIIARSKNFNFIYGQHLQANINIRFHVKYLQEYQIPSMPRHCDTLHSGTIYTIEDLNVLSMKLNSLFLNTGRQ